MCIKCFSTKPLVVAWPELGFFVVVFFWGVGYDGGLNFLKHTKKWLDCKAKEATQSDFTVNGNSFVS